MIFYVISFANILSLLLRVEIIDCFKNFHYSKHAIFQQKRAMLLNQRRFLTLLLTLCLSSSTLFAQTDYSIRFLQETFTPAENVDEFNATNNNYVLLQFKSMPTQANLQQIKAAGIILDDYIPNKTYYAFIPNSVDAVLLKSLQVRSFSIFQSKWKKSFDTNNIPEHANLVYGHADLNIKYFKNVDISEVATILQNNNAEILFIADQFNTFKIRIPIENIDALSGEGIIKSVDLITPPTRVENERSKANHRSNALAANYAGGRNLTGNGVVVGVWDTNLYPHLDFDTRTTSHQQLYAGTGGDHANHVTGTIAGSGALDPNALGMAPEATIHGWNCCTQTPLPGYVMMQNAIINQNITITSNSYGFGADCDNTPTYFTVNANYDQVVYDAPNLMHVFSAGNSQGDCPGGFFTVSWTHKNSLIVAATNQTSSITGFSSFGPLFDGRIAPTISGVGANVYSTELDNSYGNKSGTSMSGPGVSGTIAQIYERYKQLHNGINPDAALIKALVCNTADDVGNKGPDYKYGFGQINGLKAVEEMEAGNWVMDSIAQGGQNTLNITIPNNAVETRILLTWTDIPGNPNAAISLVNDLDLFLTNGTDTIYPWVLNMNSPNATATRGEDHINNIIQITADTLAAGTWTIVVEGETVTNNSQTYALVYHTYTPEIIVTYPFGGEKLEAAKLTTIHWTSAGITGSQFVQYSTNAGQTWSSLGNYPNVQRSLSWNMPYTFTNKALIRITAGNIVGQSDSTFTISSIPNFNLDVDRSSAICGEQAKLDWLPIPNATEYEVFQIDNLGIHSVAIVTDTFYSVPNLDLDVEYWFAMRALNTSQEIVGRRSIAKKITLRTSYDLSINKVKSPLSACQLSTQNVVIEIQNKGCRTFQVGEKIPMTVEVNGIITLDTFNITSPFAEGNILNYSFSNPIDFSQDGSYLMTFSNTLNSDTTDHNDVLVREIINQPTYSNLPFVESFETNNGFWTDSWSNFSTWEWAVPNNSIINSASNGNKVWMTDANENYRSHETSQLYSPCFDFSSLTQDPYLIYDINYDLGDVIDRARMMYSFNDGASWSNLGTSFFIDQSNGWETIQTQLNGAAGQANVKFRVSFNADANAELGNGLALDHFKINQSTSTTQVEEAFSVLVYPNPSFSHFNLMIDQPNATNVQIKMLDAVGKLVHEQLIDNAFGRNSWRIETNHLAKGIYFLNVNIDGQQVSRKVIVN